ncbi:MAG: YHYH protein [Gemmatimonadota bacterium]
MLARHTLTLTGLATLVACGSSGTATGTLPDDPGASLGVACNLNVSEFNSSSRVNLTSTSKWSCAGTVRTMTGNGIPNHPVTSGSFATPMSAQNLTVSMRLTPVNTGMASGSIMTPGYALNSVKFDPATAGSCTSTATSTAPGGGCVAAMGTDPWRLEAIGGAFTFGTDESNAHVQPNGQYHYHGVPEAYVSKLAMGQAMTMVGFAVDGFPIYARYGYTTATNAASAIKVVTSSWRLKAVPDAGRPSVSIFPMGTFTQDYEYAVGSGDLDECNGRSGVTPEFPSGTYHYYITDTFPYIQRCVKGTIGTS